MAATFKVVDWAKGANIYEVNVRQYTEEGTFQAFKKHLPRLRVMGVEILWFMPITPISKERRQSTLGSYYACSDYTSINPEFGTIEDFKSLVLAAQQQGFKVIIDWVANHTGYDHVWTKEHPEFYKKDEHGKFYDSNGWYDVIDLDFSNNELRMALMDAMLFWVKDCNIDGFRCDMAHLVPLDFWQQARTILDQHKQLFWLAETEEATYHQAFDASYAWELLHTMESIYKSEQNVIGLRGVMNKYLNNFPPNALRASFTTNHDENSHSGSEYERLGESAKAFAVFCMFLPNAIPLIYSGQELPNKKRLLFFDKDQIDWTGKFELHLFYKTLLALRKTHSAVLNGRINVLNTSANDKVLALLFSSKDEQLLVILNLSHSSYLKFSIYSNSIGGKYKSCFSGIETNITGHQFELQGWEYLLYSKVN